MKRLAVASLAVLALAGSATAAPRKACKLLGAGTRTPWNGLPETNPAEEIRSADIASNRTHLTAVVRLGSAEDSVGPVGRGRVVRFYFSTSAERTYFLETEVFGTTPARPSFGTGSEPYRDDANGAMLVTLTPATGQVRVVVDTARDEVRMTIPLTHFFHASARPPKAGTRVRFLAAEVRRINGFDPGTVDGYPSGLPYYATTEGKSTVAGNDTVSYALGTPSCVTVNR